MGDNRYQIMQIIACSPDTPRFPPPYHEVDVFDIQDKIMANILGEVEQQEAAALVNKPVAEEQTTTAQILQGYLNHPHYNRQELRQLRKFLKQPLVGASVKVLRQALQQYSQTNQVDGLVETVRDLYRQQTDAAGNGSAEKQPANRIKREELKY